MWFCSPVSLLLGRPHVLSDKCHISNFYNFHVSNYHFGKLICNALVFDQFCHHIPSVVSSCNHLCKGLQYIWKQQNNILSYVWLRRRGGRMKDYFILFGFGMRKGQGNGKVVYISHPSNKQNPFTIGSTQREKISPNLPFSSLCFPFLSLFPLRLLHDF